MDRTELTLAVAGALGAALLLGWILAWIAGRLNAPGGGDARVQDLAARLEAAEAGRRTAELRLSEVEADLTMRLAQAEAELASTLAHLEDARLQAEEVRAAYRASRGDGSASA